MAPPPSPPLSYAADPSLELTLRLSSVPYLDFKTEFKYVKRVDVSYGSDSSYYYYHEKPSDAVTCGATMYCDYGDRELRQGGKGQVEWMGRATSHPKHRRCSGFKEGSISGSDWMGGNCTRPINVVEYDSHDENVSGGGGGEGEEGGGGRGEEETKYA